MGVIECFLLLYSIYNPPKSLGEGIIISRSRYLLGQRLSHPRKLSLFGDFLIKSKPNWPYFLSG
ncbi:hypothetical protein YPPY36_1690 [Yersinia pestis PY-36]|nr:hypothetical protein YPPY36_1690 [Yersinia pestis PY-36]